MVMTYDPIGSFLLSVVVIYAGYLLWVYALKPAMYRVRYQEIYKLYLLELDLKERKLSFKFLDELYAEVCKPLNKKETLATIDEEYKKNKDKVQKKTQ